MLAREEVAAELICDGYHVHPGDVPRRDRRKGAGRGDGDHRRHRRRRIEAGLDSQAGRATIEVGAQAAFLDDGTLAGSTLTMDRAFRNIVTSFGGSLVDAALLCSTSPARALGLSGFGVLAEGAAADVVVLDRAFRVVRTFIGGQQVWGA